MLRRARIAFVAGLILREQALSLAAERHKPPKPHRVQSQLSFLASIEKSDTNARRGKWHSVSKRSHVWGMLRPLRVFCAKEAKEGSEKKQLAGLMNPQNQIDLPMIPTGLKSN